VLHANFCNISSDSWLIYLNFDIKPGFRAFRKNISFYLFRQKSFICGRSTSNSISKLITGSDCYLNPFAIMCAKYLLSSDSKATDSLIFSPRFLIRIRIKSSSRDFEFLGSVRRSILLMSI